jgi:hypothetical protein
MNRMRSAGREAIESAEVDVKRIDRDLDRLVDMILRGGAADRLNAKMLVMEPLKRDLEAFLAAANEPLLLLHPEMANFYRRQVHELHHCFSMDRKRHGWQLQRLSDRSFRRSC